MGDGSSRSFGQFFKVSTASAGIISFRAYEYAIWPKGSPKKTRKIYFHNFTQTEIKPVVVYSPSPNFTTAIEYQTEQKRYVIKITPADTSEEEMTAIYLDVDVGGGKIRKTKIVAIIKDPASKQVPISR